MPGTTSEWLLNFLDQGGSLPGTGGVDTPQNTQIVLRDDGVPGVTPQEAGDPEGHRKRWWPDSSKWKRPLLGITVDGRIPGPLGDLLWGYRGNLPQEGTEGQGGGTDSSDPQKASKDAGQWQHGKYGTNLEGSPYDGNPTSPFLYDAQTGGLHVTNQTQNPNPFTFQPDTTAYRQLRSDRGLSPRSDQFSPSTEPSFEVTPWMFGGQGQGQSSTGPTYRGAGGLGASRGPIQRPRGGGGQLFGGVKSWANSLKGALGHGRDF